MVDQLIQLVTYLIVVSVAAERLTDIVKRAIINKFDISTYNGALYQIISGLFGVVMAYVSPPPAFPIISLKQYMLCLVVGLAVSGGSSVWNTALNILTEIAKTKKTLNSVAL